MREELDERLCKEFPVLYADRHGDMRYTAMCWGFSCGDGWFQLIYGLSKFINDRLEGFNDDLAREYRKTKNLHYDYELTQEEKDKIGVGKLRVVVVQVKEKYGSLRYYWNMDSGGFEFSKELSEKVKEIYYEIDGAEGMATRMSCVTCEECGNPGKSRGGGWIKTLCADCCEKEGYPLECVLDEEEAP